MAPTNLSGSYAYDQMSTYPPLTSVSGSPMYISNSVPLTNKIFNHNKPKVKWIAENLATVINPHLSPSFYNDQHLKVLLLNITCHHIAGQLYSLTMPANKIWGIWFGAKFAPKYCFWASDRLYIVGLLKDIAISFQADTEISLLIISDRLLGFIKVFK